MTVKLTAEQHQQFVDAQKQIQIWVCALEEKIATLKALSQLTLQDQSAQNALDLIQGYREGIHSVSNGNFFSATYDLVESLRTSIDTEEIAQIKKGNYTWAEFLTITPESSESQALYNAKHRWAGSQINEIGPSGTWQATGQRSLQLRIPENMEASELITLTNLLESTLLPLIADMEFHDGGQYKPLGILEKSLFQHAVYMVGCRKIEETWEWIVQCTSYRRTEVAAKGTNIDELIRYLSKHLYY